MLGQGQTMTKTTALEIAVVVIAVVAAYFGGYFTGKHYKKPDVVQQVVRIDTVQHVLERQPILISRAAAKLDTIRITDHDTVYSTPAFIASLDTVVRHDTVSVSYAFPQHTFSVALRQHPDTVKLPQITIVQTEYEKRAWWVDALTHIGAASIGYAAGRAR